MKRYATGRLTCLHHTRRCRGTEAALAVALTLVAVLVPARAIAASASGPIRIGVIAPFAAIPGKSIVNGAELAVAKINASGGINGRRVRLFKYDDHFSTTRGVRAFQRAVNQDHVVAMVGGFSSEVVLALQPWSGRLHVPFLTTGTGATQITRNVREHYQRNKYTFHE